MPPIPSWEKLAAGAISGALTGASPTAAMKAAFKATRERKNALKKQTSSRPGPRE